MHGDPFHEDECVRHLRMRRVGGGGGGGVRREGWMHGGGDEEEEEEEEEEVLRRERKSRASDIAQEQRYVDYNQCECGLTESAGAGAGASSSVDTQALLYIHMYVWAGTSVIRPLLTGRQPSYACKSVQYIVHSTYIHMYAGR